MSDLESYIDSVLEKSQDFQKLKKLAIQINDIGSKVADFVTTVTPTLREINDRLIDTEEEFDELVRKLAKTPPHLIKLPPLKILGGMTAPAPDPSRTLTPSTASAPAQPTGIPNLPNPAVAASSGPTISAPNLGGAPSGGPNLGGASSGGPNLDGAPSGGPNLGGAPSGGPNLGGAPSGGPNLGGAPSGGPNLGGAPSGGPNLGGAPSGGPRLTGPPMGGGMIGADDLQSALNSLKKVSPEEKSKPLGGAPPVPGGGMVSEDAIKGALSSLKKVPKEERKEVTGISAPSAISEGAIKNALSNLKSVKRKNESKDQKKEEDDVLSKEAQVEEMSAEEMKSLLQEKLKAAFK